MRSMAAIAEGLHAAVLVAVEDLVARFARNAELGAHRRHLLALEQAGDKPESLVHDVTLLPRHAPLLVGGRVSPIRSEYAVTYRSGRTPRLRRASSGWPASRGDRTTKRVSDRRRLSRRSSRTARAEADRSLSNT